MTIRSFGGCETGVDGVGATGTKDSSSALALSLQPLSTVRSTISAELVMPRVLNVGREKHCRTGSYTDLSHSTSLSSTGLGGGGKFSTALGGFEGRSSYSKTECDDDDEAQLSRDIGSKVVVSVWKESWNYRQNSRQVVRRCALALPR